MSKRIFRLLMIVFIIVQAIFPIYGLESDSEVTLLYDIDNDCIIYEKNADEVRQVASLTKLMAVLVAIEEIDNLKQTIIVDSELIQGYYDYTKVGLQHGDKVTYEDLLYGMMLPSGADAALLIANHVSGSEEQFADLMNKKALELGMKHSHFDNAVGVDSKENYSNGNDLLKLMKYALKNEMFKTIFCTKEYHIEQLDIDIETTIRYYTKYSDIDTEFIIGSKTGFTDGASYCLASLVSHDNHPLILITLGANPNYKTSAIEDSADVYNEFAENFAYKTYLTEGERISSLPIKLGWKERYEVKMPVSLSGFIENNDNLYYHFVSVPEINRDIKKGDYIGKLEVYQNENVIGTCDFYLNETIYYHYPMIYAAVILLLIIFLYKVKNKRKRKYRRNCA